MLFHILSCRKYKIELETLVVMVTAIVRSSLPVKIKIMIMVDKIISSL
jgi:hypothetical protein